MKTLTFLFLVLAVAPVAFAQSTLTVNPSRPIIITGDFTDASGVKHNGPWCKVDITVSSDKTVSLSNMSIQTWNDDGTMSGTWDLGAIEIPAGQPYTFHDFYIDMFNASPSTVYNVQVEVDGWVGNATNPTGALKLTQTFRTK